MSQAAGPSPADLESWDSKVDDHSDQRQSALAPNQPSSPGEIDSSWPLFSMYSNVAEEEDNKKIERYQKEAEAFLIFRKDGLFIAAIATSLTVSFQSLIPNPQDISSFYLENIYRLLANPNVSQASTGISSTLATPPAFSPSRCAVWVNSLWFLSVACGITSAGLAMFLLQWTHRYLEVTQQPHLTPDQRARVREILFNHAHGPYIFWGTGPMAFLTNLSVFLFMAGGLINVFNANRVVFGPLGLWIATVIILYVLYTAASIFKPEVLFYATFASTVLRLCLGILYAVLQVSSCIPPLRRLCDVGWKRYRVLSLRYDEGFLQGKQKAIQDAALKRSTEVDPNILEKTFHCLGEDASLEKFLGAIPGFFDSKLVNNLQERLSNGFRIKFGRALNGFLDRTFSSDSTFSESVRGDRLLICLNAARAALGPGEVSRILDDISDGRWPAALQSIEVGYALRGWADIQFLSQLRRIVARIVSRVPVRERDERWIGLVRDEFGMPDHAFRDHVSSGDSVSLAILVHIIRRLLRAHFLPWDPDILRGFSNFDIRNTLPEHQHDFCATWNEVIQEAQGRGAGSTPVLILREIRHIHTALHRDADAAPVAYSGPTAGDDDILLEPSSYQFCRIINRTLGSPLRFDKRPTGDIALSSTPLHDVLNAPPFPNPIPSSPPVPLEGRNVATSLGAPVPVISAISRTTHTIPRAALASGPAQRQMQETEAISSSIGYDFPPAPTSTLSLRSRAIHSVFPAPTDSIVTSTDYIAHTPRTPFSFSSSDAARLPVSVPQQVSTVLDQSSTFGVGGAGTYTGTQDPNPPTSMEVYRRPHHSASSTPDVTKNSLQPNDHQARGPH